MEMAAVLRLADIDPELKKVRIPERFLTNLLSKYMAQAPANTPHRYSKTILLHPRSGMSTKYELHARKTGGTFANGLRSQFTIS
jgi:hypothetical protein